MAERGAGAGEPFRDGAHWEEVRNVRAFVLWEEAGKPDGADFGGEAAAQLEEALHAGLGAGLIEERVRAGLVPFDPRAVPRPALHPEEAEEPSTPAPASASAPAPAPAAVGEGEGAALDPGLGGARAGWQGGDVVFMQSNDHARDRRGRWDAAGVASAAGRALVEGDREAGSWRKKLGVVDELLRDDRSTDSLAMAAIYLQWISSGAIPCVEDGGHHRPCRHAELSASIFRAAEGLLSGGCDPPQLLAVRSIHPKLPAFKAEFTASVPLTRIRDIAHRSDIPHELKQEIKHTIQNKLHRNAGPEDLVATEAMLERILRDGPQRDGGHGAYPEDFVREFTTFHRELKEFFNATSVEERLEELRQHVGGPANAAIDAFFRSKGAQDRADPASQLAALADLTALRKLLVAELAGAPFDAAADTNDVARRQLLRLSEIGLEDFGFVVLSSAINALEAQGPGFWPAAVAAASAAVEHVGLSGWEPAECAAILRDLALLAGGLGDAVDEGTGLQLMAVLERTRRVAEGYTDAVLDLYPERSVQLGEALGVEPHVIQTFSEAEIRANVVFQATKLCSLMLKALRAAMGHDAWDCIVAGSAAGVLLPVDRIAPGAVPAEYADRDVVLLVKGATGDEEASAAGANIRGVVLCHELPHLSHLGVRARQEGVVFATCTDPALLAPLRGLQGQAVDFTAGPAGVACVPSGASAPARAGGEAAAKDSPVTLPPSKKPVPAPEPPAAAAAPTGAEEGDPIVEGTVFERYEKDPANPFRGLPVPRAAELPATPADAAPLGAAASGCGVVGLEEATAETCGAKAATCGHLASLSALSEGDSAFKTPGGVCLPFGSMEACVEAAGLGERLSDLLAASEHLDGEALEACCADLRALVGALQVAPAVLAEVGELFAANGRVIVRSSANVEDLEGMSGAGLYDSICNVDAADPADLGRAVTEVWASLYTRRAVLSRRAAGVAQRAATMGVLVQELLAPETSFVLMTMHPMTLNKQKLYAELAPGLGETLASGTQGTPWRMEVDKISEDVKTLALANFSEGLRFDPHGGFGGRIERFPVDYSQQPLSTDPAARDAAGKRLVRVGTFLEAALGVAQDIEGGFVDGEVYIVQSRPQA